MEFFYTIDPGADEPIMLIDRHIGWDDEEGEGIMGDKFCRELLFLDKSEKSKINIWIHSPGGKVADGEKIVASILKSKTKVDTYNLGMVASIAGPIWLAGRNRYMMDYAKFMMHPVGNYPDEKSRKAFEDSVITMLSSRVDISPDVIRKMVNETTWLNAQQCGPEGLNICTIEKSADMNKPRKPLNPTNFSESFKELTSVVNQLIKEKKQKTPMDNLSQITNKLGLNKDANESSILSAIESIENKFKEAATKLVSQETENKAKLDLVNKQVTDLTAERDALKTKFTEIENAVKAEKEAAAKADAETKVNALVAAGKIENKAEIIEEYKALAIESPARFDKITNALPVNKAMPVTSKTITTTEAGNTVPKYTAAGVMAKIAIENKQTTV